MTGTGLGEVSDDSAEPVHLRLRRRDRTARRPPTWLHPRRQPPPREIGPAGRGEILVVGLNNILFDDRDAAVALAVASAERGAAVGILTYDPTQPCLDV